MNIINQPPCSDLASRVQISCVGYMWVQHLNGATKKPIGEPEALIYLHGQQRFNHNVTGYGLAPDRLYMTFWQVRSNVWIADPL